MTVQWLGECYSTPTGSYAALTVFCVVGGK